MEVVTYALASTADTSVTSSWRIDSINIPILPPFYYNSEINEFLSNVVEIPSSIFFR
jgi:hypothetical protein